MRLLWILATLLLGASLALHARWAVRVFARGEGRVETAHLTLLDTILAGGLAGFFGMLAIGLNAGASSPHVDLGNLASALLLYAAVLGTLGLSLFVRRMSPSKFFGLDRLPAGQAFGLGALALGAAYPLLGLMMFLGERLSGGKGEGQAIVQFFLQTGDPVARFLVILFAVVAAPIFEETVFRGYLYPVLKRHAGGLFAAVVTSALFAVIHDYPPSWPAFFVLATVFVLAYERAGSIFVPMAMHSCFNALSVAWLILSPQEGASLAR